MASSSTSLIFKLLMLPLQVVAVAVMQCPSQEEWDRLQINFATETYVSYPEVHKLKQLGVIKALCIHQAFIAHTPFLFRELMRQSFKRALVYEALPKDALPVGVKVHMRPVRPRKIVVLPQNKKGVPGILGEGQSLHVTTTNLIYRQKNDVNVRVVLVGGGTCGLSFLENLLFDPAYNFTNVSVISPNGLAEVSIVEA